MKKHTTKAIHDERKPFSQAIIISLFIVYFILTSKGCFHFQVSEQWILILRNSLVMEDIFWSAFVICIKKSLNLLDVPWVFLFQNKCIPGRNFFLNLSFILYLYFIS